MLETLFNPIYTTNFTFSSYIICTVTSLVLGFIIAISSGFKSRQSCSFLLSLFFLPAIVQPVIMLVNGSAGTGCIQRQQRQVAYHKRRLCSGRRSGDGQCTIMTDITTQSADTMFTLCDSNSNVIASFKSAKQFSNVVVSSPSLKTGESYKIICGGTIDGADENGFADGGKLTSGTEITDITMTEENYSSGGGSMHGGGMRGGSGRMPPR